MNKNLKNYQQQLKDLKQLLNEKPQYKDDLAVANKEKIESHINDLNKKVDIVEKNTLDKLYAQKRQLLKQLDEDKKSLETMLVKQGQPIPRLLPEAFSPVSLLDDIKKEAALLPRHSEEIVDTMNTLIALSHSIAKQLTGWKG